MRYLSYLLLLLTIFSLSPANAQKKSVQLIDRAVFFEQPAYSDFQMSPDGKWISFIKKENGHPGIYLRATNESSKTEKLISESGSTSPVSYFWSKDGKFIVYIANEKGEFSIQSISIANEAEQAHTLTRILPTVHSVPVIYHISEKKPENIFIGLNKKSDNLYDLYQLDITNGKLDLILENYQQIKNYHFDRNDSLRLITTTDGAKNVDYTLIILPDYQYDTIITTHWNEKTELKFWNSDNSKIFFVSNTQKEDLTALYEYDFKAQKIQLVEKDPENKSDLQNIYFDPFNKELAGTTYFYEKPKAYWKNASWQAISDSIQSKFLDVNIQLLDHSNALDKFVFSISSDTIASDIYYYDTTTKSIHFICSQFPELKKTGSSLSQMTGIIYKSTDGTDIPAYITLPNQKKSKKLPLIVLIHDAPHSGRVYWEYQAVVQFLASRGYAVFQPNYRGSSGYGKKFSQSGYQQWGLLIQDDITAGVRHLIKEGIADHKHVIIMGTGFGGYAAMMGLALNPELYAAGIDIFGYNHLEHMVKSVPEHWNNIQKNLIASIGDPYTKAGVKKLQEQSPYFNLPRIKKPLLIVQNAEDPFVRLSETNHIVSTLNQQTEVQYLLIRNEKDAIEHLANLQAIYAAVEKFLAEKTKNNFQSVNTSVVEEKIKELKVNIDSTLIPDISKFVAQKRPVSKAFLNNHEFSYEVTYEYNHQSYSFIKYRKYKKEDTRWRVEENSGNDKTEKIYYSLQFQPMYREVAQSGEKSEITFADNRIYYNNKTGQKDIQAPVSYLFNGPGMDFIIGSLPLRKDYQFYTYLTDDFTDGFKPCIIKVIGEEKINYRDHFIVEISNLADPEDSITLWINMKNRLMTKSVQKIPALGNTVITTIKQE